MISPILQMWKLRQKFKRLAQGQLNDKWQSQDLNPGSLVPKLLLACWHHEVIRGLGSDWGD